MSLSTREWRRVSIETICGGCESRVPAEGPMLYITLPHVKTPRKRCEKCAGPAPPDLPPRERAQQFTKPMRPTRGIAAGFTRAKLNDTDWTARILGERE